MRILSIIVSCLAVIGAFFCVAVVSKFSELYAELDVTLPTFTGLIVDSSGWVPGGLFLLLAITLVGLIVFRKDKIAGIFARITMALLILTAVILPFLLYLPLPGLITSLESQEETKKQNKLEMATPRAPPD